MGRLPYWLCALGCLVLPCTAQRLGLVPVSQPLLLTETEWQSVKGQSLARKDSDMPCAICREGFGLKQQVGGWGLACGWAGLMGDLMRGAGGSEGQ